MLSITISSGKGDERKRMIEEKRCLEGLYKRENNENQVEKLRSRQKQKQLK